MIWVITIIITSSKVKTNTIIITIAITPTKTTITTKFLTYHNCNFNHLCCIERWRSLILGHHNEQKFRLSFKIQRPSIRNVSGVFINCEIIQRVSTYDGVLHCGIQAIVFIGCLVMKQKYGLDDQTIT
jgi:hypothetical protein